MGLRIWCAQVKHSPINIKKLSETTPAFAILSKEPTYDHASPAPFRATSLAGNEKTCLVQPRERMMTRAAHGADRLGMSVQRAGGFHGSRGRQPAIQAV
jgi:hypothetical protein